MKKTKFVALFLIVAMIFIIAPMNSFAAPGWLEANDSTFEEETTSWYSLGGGTVSTTDNPSGTGNSLKYEFGSEKQSYWSPALRIKQLITRNMSAAGTVQIRFDVYFEASANVSSLMRIRTQNVGDLDATGAQKFMQIGTESGLAPSEWHTMTGEFNVTAADLQKTSGEWSLCLDGIANSCTAVYIDNVVIQEKSAEPIATPTHNPSNTPDTNPEFIKSEDGNFVGTGSVNSSFENATSVSELKWGTVAGTLEIVENPDGEGKCLQTSIGANHSWYSPKINIYPIISANESKAFTALIKIRVYIVSEASTSKIRPIIRGTAENSFMKEHSGKFWGGIGSESVMEVNTNEWIQLELKLPIENGDFIEGSEWDFCFDSLSDDIEFLLVDDFFIANAEQSSEPKDAGDTVLVSSIVLGIAFMGGLAFIVVKKREFI